MRHDQPPVTVVQDHARAHARLLEDQQSEGDAKTDQVSRQGADQEHVGANGGRGEVVAVSAGNVRRDTRREPAGRRL